MIIFFEIPQNIQGYRKSVEKRWVETNENVKESMKINEKALQLY